MLNDGCLAWLGVAALLPFAAYALCRRRPSKLGPLARAAAMEGTDDAVLVFDAAGQLADANPAARRWLALAPILPERPAAEILAAWPELAEGIGQDGERQLCLATAGLPPKVFAAHLFPLREGDGRLRGQVLVLRDISAQQAAEERYRQLLESNPLGITVVETATGLILYANQKAADLLGTPRAQLVGLAAVNFYANPPDRERITRLMAERGRVADYEVCFKSSTGQARWCLVTTTPTIYDGRRCHISSVIDITERKEAEAMRQAQAQTEAVERQQRAILEHLPAGVVLTGCPGHKLLYQNARFAEMFGYTAEQIPDLAHWWLLACPDPGYREWLIGEWDRRIAQVKNGQTRFEPLEAIATARDGAARPVSVHASAMGDLCVLAFIDLSERRQAEQARRERDAAEAANRAKSRFLANMSHEIRTPLNAILGFTQVLQRDPGLDPGHRDKLLTIHRSGEHLLELLNDILDMAKIEAGHLSLKHQPFDLAQLIAETESLFRQRARERSLALRVEKADLPRYVEGDETKLRQVLINLLSNAVKFTREGTVTLGVEAQANGGIRFSVADTGMGIAPHEMERLFEPFSQTASGRNVQEGSGLGLAISRQYVRMMGGELEAASMPGQGSRFHFALPLAAAAETADTTAASRSASPLLGLVPGQAARRVLIADDCADNRAPLRALLDSLNPKPPVLEFREAADGQETLAIWHQWQPHLLFIDLRMPRLSGAQAARQIKAWMAERPGAAQTVIVALTASVPDAEREQLLAAGCDAFARKPFRAEELFAILQQRLGLDMVQGPKPPEPPAELPRQELADRLARCPADWREALRVALDCGDFSKVRQLVEQAKDRDPALHAALAKWAYDSNHEAILGLFEEPWGQYTPAVNLTEANVEAQPL